jgi:aspartate--ammonia ligase
MVYIDHPSGKTIIPENYHPYLDIRDTESAIKFVKDYFEEQLAKELNLQRVSAPLFLPSGSGLNDELSGVERPIGFRLKSSGQQGEIVQSLAKWKRLALKQYGFISGEGLYTDMNAIRCDEPVLDNLHSIYVDQWDWERIIAEHERNLEVLKYIVRKIYRVIRHTEQIVCRKYHQLPGRYLPDEIYFIHSEELEELYPDLTPKERENEICRQKKAVFIIGIGAPLKNGKAHDERAADYDDWSTLTGNNRRGLNGDIIVWYPPLQCALELSSMGIRVDAQALKYQLNQKNENYKLELPFHKQLVNNELPLSIGGGIGQSRLCMFYLRKVHIGEVQASIWPEEVLRKLADNGCKLL